MEKKKNRFFQNSRLEYRLNGFTSLKIFDKKIPCVSQNSPIQLHEKWLSIYTSTCDVSGTNPTESAAAVWPGFGIVLNEVKI